MSTALLVCVNTAIILVLYHRCIATVRAYVIVEIWKSSQNKILMCEVEGELIVHLVVTAQFATQVLRMLAVVREPGSTTAAAV